VNDAPYAQSSLDAATAAAAAAAICRRRCPDLYFASFFLRATKRRSIHALAAFCGMIQDAIGSNAAAADSCASHMALLRDRLDEIYADRLELPASESRDESQQVLAEVVSTIRQYQIPQQHFIDFADGCAAHSTVRRFATWSSLEKYCHQSAGAVALMMSCVLGLTHSDAAHYAAAMGKPVALTRILRDVKADWQHERLYLPLEDLAQFKYSERDLAAGRVNEQFRSLMKFEVERARTLFEEAAAGVCWLGGDGSRMMASTIALTQSGVLDAIKRKDYDVLGHTVRITWPQKLARLPRAWRLARREPGEPVPNVF
jgi:phytoene synthase